MINGKKSRWVLVVALVVITLVTLGIFNRRKSYEFIKAKKGDVLEAIYGLGKVQTDEIYELKVGVLTNVKKLYVKEGDFVEKGTKLIWLDQIDAFKAPFSGTVTLADYRDGEIVSPQVPLVRLENLDRKFVQVSLEQEAALKVKPGQQAKLVFQSLSGEKLTGQVEKVYPKSGEFIARIQVGSMSSSILPGMTVDVVIEVGSKKDVTLIPLRAITSRQVIRKRGLQRKKVDVMLGHTDGLWAELVDGDILLTDELLVKRKD